MKSIINTDLSNFLEIPKSQISKCQDQKTHEL